MTIQETEQSASPRPQPRPSPWVLVPLYVASAVLTLGEGAIAVLVPPYMDERGFNAGIVGVILAVYGVAALAARVPAAGWYRSSRATLLVSGGCLVMALSFVLLPLTASPWVIGMLVGLDGVGFATATTATMAALMDRRHPDADAGSIMGWYAGTFGLGYAAAGFVAGGVADATGVTTAIVVLAAVPALAAVLLAVALRIARPIATAEAAAGRGADEADATSIPTDEGATRRRGGLRALATASPAVWLAFLVCLHVSLGHGVLSAFFPLYGLDVGLSIGQIGALLGVHGILAGGIRFLSGPLFRVVPYRKALPWMIVLNSLAVAGMGFTTMYAVFVVAWGAVGLSRGILRVASGALVMDEAGATDTQRGAASGLYLAGLDVGKIAGPLVGGALAELFGLRGVFATVGVVFAFAYFVLAHRVQRGRPTAASSPA